MTLNEVVQNIDVWTNWVNSYKNYVPKFIEEAQNKEKWEDWNKDIFREFFEQGRNQCVSSLQQGYFTNDEKAKIKKNWHEIAPLLKKIAISQDRPLFDVYELIERNIRKYTTLHRRASTYRLIAGLQPKLLSTVVNKNNLAELFYYLKKYVDEPLPEFSGNWYKDSYNIAQYYKEHIKVDNLMDLIAYPWQSLVHFKEEATITSNEMSETDIKNSIDSNSLNQILYGPPGTGKTYATKELAVKIANPNFVLDTSWDDEKKRKEIVKEYDILFESGQIIFTTFHQSMSYEDFVEGIKPKTINNQVEYEVEDGIFKQICQKASVKNGNFDDVIEKLKHDISELDGKPALTIKYANNSFLVVYRGTSVFYVQPQNTTKDNPWYPVNINNMRIAFDTDDYSRLYNPTYIREILNYLVKEYALVKGKRESKKNYVLIIDEINRGNVSAIFGELITLLETDKRIGENEQIFLDLPYSKNEKFGVPNNLYLIGTMNTADRSVEALDTALRRRFSFTEVMPEPKLLEGKFVDGIALDKLLEKINKRVEILLDRDHTIGHSYFIKLKKDDIEGLKQVFKNCIIPLLQEYFYGDYEKIGMIIGNGFFDETEKYDSDVFASFTSQNYPESGKLLRLKNIDEDFDIIYAIKKLLNIKEEKKTDA
ncbi:McrB family protein [Flavobacterium sp. LAR06]|uniref:McrB family protein n=1 Tax=Flavobacterium sp. LAR06 TaxID=3064897 RepID=UPI0035BF3C60